MMVKVEIANFKLQRYYCLIFLFTWFLNSSILSANLVLLLLLCQRVLRQLEVSFYGAESMREHILLDRCLTLYALQLVCALF